MASWALWRASLPSAVADHVERIEKVNERIHHDDGDDEEEGCDVCHGTTWIFLAEPIHRTS